MLYICKIKENNETIQVWIEDDGCGMSEETLKNVVNPFFTTRTTRNSRHIH